MKETMSAFGNLIRMLAITTLVLVVIGILFYLIVALVTVVFFALI